MRENTIQLNDLSISETLYLKYHEIRADLIDLINVYRRDPNSYNKQCMNNQYIKYNDIYEYFKMTKHTHISSSWLHAFEDFAKAVLDVEDICIM